MKRNNYGRAGAMAVKKEIDEVGVERILRAIKGYPDE
jgi:ribosomal protein L19